jgi:hypothetical protein
MSKLPKLYILIAFTIFLGVLIGGREALAESRLVPMGMATVAQDDTCDQDILTIMEQITQICEALGKNEICYGNRQVEITPRQDDEPVEFMTPGDLLPLNQVRSLRLSTLDLEQNLWGVAQIRLLLADFRNLQDVELLLFGDVQVQDPTQDRLTVPIIVNSDVPINLRTTPDLNGLVVTVAQPTQSLMAVARNLDGTWIQVEEPTFGYVGWVFADLIAVADAGQSLDNLLISDGDDAYWKPMQAFMFQSGDSASCNNSLTDGMLIQTSDGLSRISFLINEVAVELLPGTNRTRATAFVQSNVANGMNLSVLDGRAQVTVGETTYEVTPNTVLTIPLNPNGLPVGTASISQTAPASSNWMTAVIEAKQQAEAIAIQAPPENNTQVTGGNNTQTTGGNNTQVTGENNNSGVTPPIEGVTPPIEAVAPPENNANPNCNGVGNPNCTGGNNQNCNGNGNPNCTGNNNGNGNQNNNNGNGNNP